MSERITYTQVEKLTEGKDRTMARLIEQTCEDINRAEERIRTLLAQVASIAERVQRALDEGGRMNSLGEFQRTPAELDLAIAARQSAWETLGRLVGEEAANALAAGAA